MQETGAHEDGHFILLTSVTFLAACSGSATSRTNVTASCRTIKGSKEFLLWLTVNTARHWTPCAQYHRTKTGRTVQPN